MAWKVKFKDLNYVVCTLNMFDWWSSFEYGMCIFIQACEIPWHVIYDFVHYMLNMRPFGMNCAILTITMKYLCTMWWLWNTRSLCNGYEIFVHYVMDMKYMCIMWLNMIYMVGMKINGKTTSRALSYSRSGLGDHRVLQWLKQHLKPRLVAD